MKACALLLALAACGPVNPDGFAELATAPRQLQCDRRPLIGLDLADADTYVAGLCWIVTAPAGAFVGTSVDPCAAEPSIVVRGGRLHVFVPLDYSGDPHPRLSYEAVMCD